MQVDFHYYATYAAAGFAGFSPAEMREIAEGAALVDFFNAAYLVKIGGPTEAATTQFQLDLADMTLNRQGIQEITQIWSSFHFLPGDLYAEVKGTRWYRRKYRLICNTNSDLLVKTVELAKGKAPMVMGIAMHVLADTWAHRYFAGTPSLVINNTNRYFYEEMPDGTEKQVKFKHALGVPDDPDKGFYINSPYQSNERSIMNLGHGRAGHFPDYSFAVYSYLPAWGGYGKIRKDNPSDFYHAFGQMIHALKYLRGEIPEFKKDTYEFESFAPYDERIWEIIRRRQLWASEDWKQLGEEVFGEKIPDFQADRHQEEYMTSQDHGNTWLGQFILGALRQKRMVTEEIAASGNPLAGKTLYLTGSSVQLQRDALSKADAGDVRKAGSAEQGKGAKDQ